MMNVQKPIWVMTLVDSRYRFILRLCLLLSRQKIITGNFSRLHPNNSKTVTTTVAANRIELGEKFICWMRTQLLLTIFLIVNFSILIKQPRRASEQTKHVFVQFDIAYRFVRSFICSFIRVAHSFRGVLNTRSFSLLSQRQWEKKSNNHFFCFKSEDVHWKISALNTLGDQKRTKKKCLTNKQMYTVSAFIVFCSRFCVSVCVCDKL